LQPALAAWVEAPVDGVDCGRSGEDREGDVDLGHGLLRRREHLPDADRILVEGAPHVMIFPNLFIAEIQMFTIQPLAPDLTVRTDLESLDESVARVLDAITYNRPFLREQCVTT